MLILLLLGSGACAPLATPSPTPTPLPPTATPGPVIDLSLPDLSGTETTLSALSGEVTLVTFWASWCTACEEELPVLQAFYQAHAAEGFQLVGVNTGDFPADAQQYLIEHQLDFPCLSDPTGKRLIEMGVNGLPYSLLLDRQGRRVSHWYGTLPPESLDGLVLPRLKADGS
jgi:thiol-disulfide isomerase/thioredoxin